MASNNKTQLGWSTQFHVKRACGQRGIARAGLVTDMARRPAWMQERSGGSGVQGVCVECSEWPKVELNMFCVARLGGLACTLLLGA